MADNNIESVSIFSADVSQLAQTFTELMAQIQQTRDEMAGLKKNTAEYNALAQKLTQQEVKLAKAFKDGSMQIDKESVSYRQLNNVLKDLRKTYREVGSEEERQDITQGIQAFDKELKSMDANIGQFQRNVGNYAGAMGNVAQVFLEGATNAGILDRETSSIFLKLTRDIPKLIQGLSKLDEGAAKAGDAAVEAGAKSSKALGGVVSKLGAIAVAIAAAAVVYKLFQSEIDRGIKKLKDWGKELLGINDYTINNTKNQKEFNEALKQSTSQLAGQVATYRILEQLATKYVLSQKDQKKVTSELLKDLKEWDTAKNRAKVSNDEYAESIDNLVDKLYKEAEAAAVVQYMTGKIQEIIDLQNEIIEKRLQRNETEANKQAGRIKGFWNALKVGIISMGGDISTAIDMVNEKTLDNIDKDIADVEKKIKEIKDNLPKEFKELMEAIFPDGDGPGLIVRALFGDSGTGNGNDSSWYSTFELAIKEAEAIEEDYWKFSKKGYTMYMNMYDEIANHYKSDVRKYREALANKKKFHKEYMDYIKKLNETDQDYGASQYEKELNELERWHDEQIKIYESVGKETTRLEAEYAKRKERIAREYKDKYQELNQQQIGIVVMLTKYYNASTEAMKKEFKELISDSTKGYYDYTVMLQKASGDLLLQQKSQIIADGETRQTALRKQREDELYNLKERLGDTEEYEKQKTELLTYYENKAAEIHRNTQAEIENATIAHYHRMIDNLDSFYESRNRKAEQAYAMDIINNERNDWNHGFGRMGQTTAQDEIKTQIEQANTLFATTQASLEDRMGAIVEKLTNSQAMSVEARLELEQEFVTLSQQLEDERLNHELEINGLMLEADKQLAADRVQAFQESFSQIGNLLGAVYSAYEANIQAQLKEGKISQEQAEKQLEEYRGIKAAGAAMDALGSAVGAYNSMASIPYVGPALGAIAAAAALAAGYANVRQILATNKNNVGNGGTQYKEVTPTQADYSPTYVTNLTGQQETENLANALTDTPIWVSVQDIDSAQEKGRVRVQESTF